MNSSPSRDLSPQAIEELKTQFARVQLFATAVLMWQRLLTAEERSQLGRNVAAAWRRRKTIGMWTEVRGGSDEEALLEIAHRIEHLSQPNYEWLRRELGLPITPKTASTEQVDAAAQTIDSPAHPQVPRWEKAIGRLQYRSHRIRTVRMTTSPNNIQRILDAFEEQGWRRQIDNPLPGGLGVLPKI